MVSVYGSFLGNFHGYFRENFWQAPLGEFGENLGEIWGKGFENAILRYKTLFDAKQTLFDAKTKLLRITKTLVYTKNRCSH